jgi:hypothetical protein
MSAKSDRDNRSNQLNQNNDAYYSSRGSERAGEAGDDNHEDIGVGRQVRDIGEELSRYFAQEEHSRRMQERDRPEIGMYVGIFVGLDGTTAFIPIKLSANPFMGNREGARARNEDFAELVVGEIGRQLILRWGCPLALRTVLDSDGNDMFWSGYQYPIGCGSANRAQNERLWNEHGEKAVANVRALLSHPTELRQLQNRYCRYIESDPELARSWNHNKLKQTAEQLVADHLPHCRIGT